MLMLRILLLLALSALPATAGTYGKVPEAGVAKVQLLPGWRDGTTQYAAIRIHLAPGWKTYWRAPGDAGIPPEVNWSGSRNLRAAAFHWPVPHVFDLGGLQSIGYKGDVVLPLILTAADPAAPIELRGHLQIGVCLDVCLPVDARLSAEVPAGGTPDPRIRAALSDRALTAAEAGVSAVSCAVEPIRDGLRLSARIDLPPQGRDEVVVIETAAPGVWVSPADSRRTGGALTASADLVPPEQQPFALDRSGLRITVIGDGRAVDIQGCPAG